MTLGELLPNINFLEDIKLTIYFSENDYDVAYKGSVLNVPWVYMKNNLYTCDDFESISISTEDGKYYLDIAIEDN